jgi:hypothetical protein
MLLPLSNGPDHGAQINGSHSIPDPPLCSAFKGAGGGGPESAIIFTQIWTVQNRAHEFMAHIGFRTPPPILPLTGGGVRNW